MGEVLDLGGVYIEFGLHACNMHFKAFITGTDLFGGFELKKFP